jgi:CRISPR-associated protein Csd2
MSAIENRYDFAYLFDVKDGNPNGDPDAGNMPRVDAETGMGLVTDVCLKRKVRNYVLITAGGKEGYDIYVKEKAVLVREHERAYKAIGAEDALKAEGKKRKGGDKVEEARRWMCGNFYDVRTFGAVMSLGVNCGQVRGPIQMTFARTIEPIVSLEHSITRMAVATEKEAEEQGGDNRTMGRKHTVPYGLYRSHGFVSANLASSTGFSQDDLEVFWQALRNMFDHDRSAARGEMTARGLFVFKHSSALGNAPAHSLLDRIKLARSQESVGPARSFSDYEVTLDRSGMPQGVELIVMV